MNAWSITHSSTRLGVWNSGKWDFNFEQFIQGRESKTLQKIRAYFIRKTNLKKSFVKEFTH
jgi:hypothetical protein